MSRVYLRTIQFMGHPAHKSTVKLLAVIIMQYLFIYFIKFLYCLSWLSASYINITIIIVSC